MVRTYHYLYLNNICESHLVHQLSDSSTVGYDMQCNLYCTAIYTLHLFKQPQELFLCLLHCNLHFLCSI